MASASPETERVLRAEVVPYSPSFFDPRAFSVGLALANVFLIMLVVVVSANVALLMFARAASREIEIGVRHALGASRGRIVLQLFLEAVVLSALSAIAGLAAARYAHRVRSGICTRPNVGTRAGVLVQRSPDALDDGLRRRPDDARRRDHRSASGAEGHGAGARHVGCGSSRPVEAATASAACGPLSSRCRLRSR